MGKKFDCQSRSPLLKKSILFRTSFPRIVMLSTLPVPTTGILQNLEPSEGGKRKSRCPTTQKAIVGLFKPLSTPLSRAIHWYSPSIITQKIKERKRERKTNEVQGVKKKKEKRDREKKAPLPPNPQIPRIDPASHPHPRTIRKQV